MVSSVKNRTGRQADDKDAEGNGKVPVAMGTSVSALCHLPLHLHARAIAFLDWLEQMADGEPTHCPHCDSRDRRVRCPVGPRCRRKLYECKHCGGTYNALTGSPLAGLHHPHLWRTFMVLRLAGQSYNAICTQMPLSLHGASTWDQQFLRAMASKAPQLHRWWAAHQLRRDTRMPVPIAQQAGQFLAWVRTMSRKPGRLEGTPFYRLAFRPLWAPYVDLLLQGSSDRDMGRALAISSSCARHWRRRFTEALEQHYPDLYSWLVWQRARRRYQVGQ